MWTARWAPAPGLTCCRACARAAWCPRPGSTRCGCLGGAGAMGGATACCMLPAAHHLHPSLLTSSHRHPRLARLTTHQPTHQPLLFSAPSPPYPRRTSGSRCTCWTGRWWWRTPGPRRSGATPSSSGALLWGQQGWVVRVHGQRLWQGGRSTAGQPQRRSPSCPRRPPQGQAGGGGVERAAQRQHRAHPRGQHAAERRLPHLAALCLRGQHAVMLAAARVYFLLPCCPAVCPPTSLDL